ncbi:MAG: superoxide dismutase family protein [Inquilinaceae bacterium]
MPVTRSLLFAALTACALAAPPVVAQEGAARAVFVDPDGRETGSASLLPSPHGVLIIATFDRLPPGTHAFHIHERGLCEGPDFGTAGGHFNPTGAAHGFLMPDGMHAGDLPNITAGDDGTLRVEVFASLVTLGDGPNALLDGDGSALMVHQGPDDHRSDPAGDAGPRIACGVIER